MASLTGRRVGGRNPISELRDRIRVNRVKLTGNLDYQIPDETRDYVHTVVFVQDATGGRTVTHNGRAVPIAASGSTAVTWVWDGTAWRIPTPASTGRGFQRKGASSGLSTVSGTPLTVTYASTVYDDDGRFVLNADGSAKCQVAGRYRMTAMVQYGNVVGTGVREFSIEINGVGVTGYTAASVAWWRGNATVTRDLAVNDVVRVRANQTSGAALAVADALFEVLSVQ